MSNEVTVNLRVDKYTNRILGVVKEMFGLKDKGEALTKFVHIYGDSLVDIDANEDVCKEIVASCNAHIAKHSFRKMSVKELDKLSGFE